MEEFCDLTYHAFRHQKFEYNILCILVSPRLEIQKLKIHIGLLIQATTTEKQKTFIRLFSKATPDSITELLAADPDIAENIPLKRILNSIQSAPEKADISAFLATLAMPDDVTTHASVQASSSKIRLLSETIGNTVENTTQWIRLIIQSKSHPRPNPGFPIFIAEVQRLKDHTELLNLSNLFSFRCNTDQILTAISEDNKTIIFFANDSKQAPFLETDQFNSLLTKLLNGKIFKNSFKKCESHGFTHDAIQDSKEFLEQLQKAILESNMLLLLTESSTKKQSRFTVTSHLYQNRSLPTAITAAENPGSSSTVYEDEDSSCASPSERRPSVIHQDRPRFQIRIQITAPILEMTAKDQEASFSQEEDIDLKIFMKNPHTNRIVNCQLQLTNSEKLQAYSGADEIAFCLEKLLIAKFGNKTAFIIKISADSTEPVYYAKSQLTTGGDDLTHLPFLELLDYDANTEYREDIQEIASAAFTLFDMNANSALVLNPYHTFRSSLPAPSRILDQTPPPAKSSSPLLQDLEAEIVTLRAQSAQKALEATHLPQRVHAEDLLPNTPPSSVSKPRELFFSPAVLAARQEQDAMHKRLEELRSHQKSISTPRTPHSAARRLLAESPTSSSKPSSPAELATKIHKCRSDSAQLAREIQTTRHSLSPMRLFPLPASSPVSPNAADQAEASLNPNESLLGLSPSKTQDDA